MAELDDAHLWRDRKLVLLGILQVQLRFEHLRAGGVDTGGIIGIRLLDHIIIGGNGHFSFADEGLLENSRNIRACPAVPVPSSTSKGRAHESGVCLRRFTHGGEARRETGRASGARIARPLRAESGDAHDHRDGTEERTKESGGRPGIDPKPVAGDKTRHRSRRRTLWGTDRVAPGGPIRDPP
ncbi:MAG: JAB domain-containing protein [Acidobacteriota bacterium]